MSACTPDSHAALKADPVAWAALPRLGACDYDGLVLEYRNCSACRSTLAVEVASEATQEAA